MRRTLMMTIVSCLSIFVNSVTTEISWKVSKLGTFGKVFEAFVPVSDVGKKREVLSDLLANLHLELSTGKNGSYSYYKEETSTSVKFILSFKESVEKGTARFYYDSMIIPPQESTSQTALNPPVPIPNSSSPTYVFVPSELSVKYTSYYVNSKDNKASKYTALGLKIILTISGVIVMVNSVFRLNGMLLLRFMQMMDLINFFDMLNVNTREGIIEVLGILNNLSANKFMMMPLPIEFSHVKNKFSRDKGRLTEKLISPVLLENQLPETIILFSMIALDYIFSFFRCCPTGQRLSNLMRSFKFGFVHLIFVEQFFYSCYQLVSAYNYKSTQLENLISYACAFFSLAIICWEMTQIVFVGVTGYAEKVKSHKEREKKVGFLTLQVVDEENEESDTSKIDDEGYIKEFIESEINEKKLHLGWARMYNILFELRLAVLGLSCLLITSSSYFQIGVITLYNLFIFFTTIRGIFCLGFFASFWVWLQRLVQEVLIFLIFMLLMAFGADSKEYFLTVDTIVWLTVTMILLLGCSIMTEIAFFILNLIKSIVLAVYYFFRWLSRCRNSKKKGSNKRRIMSESSSRVSVRGLDLKRLKRSSVGSSDSVKEMVSGSKIRRSIIKGSSSRIKSPSNISIMDRSPLPLKEKKVNPFLGLSSQPNFPNLSVVPNEIEERQIINHNILMKLDFQGKL